VIQREPFKSKHLCLVTWRSGLRHKFLPKAGLGFGERGSL
jgi:hypothetical protein